MDHQVIGNQLNRRSFLSQSALGLGALAGLPSLEHPLLAAAPDKTSHIQTGLNPPPSAQASSRPTPGKKVPI